MAHLESVRFSDGQMAVSQCDSAAFQSAAGISKARLALAERKLLCLSTELSRAIPLGCSAQEDKWREKARRRKSVVLFYQLDQNNTMEPRENALTCLELHKHV